MGDGVYKRRCKLGDGRARGEMRLGEIASSRMIAAKSRNDDGRLSVQSEMQAGRREGKGGMRPRRNCKIETGSCRDQ